MKAKTRQRRSQEQVCIYWNTLHLRQLEDMLLAVYELESAIGEPAANISGVQPAIRIKSLSCLLRILEVALEDIEAFITHLHHTRV